MDIQSRGNFIVFHVRHQFDVHLLKVLTRFYFGKCITHLDSKQFSLKFSFKIEILSRFLFSSIFITCIFDLFLLLIISLDPYILWRSWENRSLASLVLNLRYKMDQARFEMEFKKDALHNICKLSISLKIE